MKSARDVALREVAAAKVAATNEPGAKTSWMLGRALFDLGEYLTNKREKAQTAEEGISACRRALELDPELAAAHYYWGMNLGQLARTKGMGALSLVQKLREHFEAARKRDASFDYAGPDRNLGYLYRDTPSWISIGDEDKARFHLTEAVRIAPELPENRIALAEGYISWGEYQKAAEQVKALDEGMAAARQKFSGPYFAVSWVDWDERLAKVRRKLGAKLPKAKNP